MRGIQLQVFVFALVAISSSLAKVCPYGYSLQYNVCYRIHTSPRSWTDARSFCGKEFANLISIRSDSMYRFLHRYSKSHDVNMWVGASDRYGEGHHSWEDGRRCCTKWWWLPGEPNNSGNEDCVHLYTRDAGGLNDEECSTKFAYICEKQGCPDIQHCQPRYQTCSHSDNTCSRCVDNRVFFKLTNHDRMCERMCSWNSHFCWPGTCSEDLTRGCACATGFHMVSTLSETSCQLNPDIKPSIQTCETVIVGPNGEKKRAETRTLSRQCQDLTDFVGNFQPTQVTSTFLAEFTVDVKRYATPSFISETRFGVTDSNIYIKKKDLTGKDVATTSHPLKTDNGDSTNATETFPKDTNITVSGRSFKLSNGQRLCVQYEAKAGGYLKGKRTDGNILSAVPYSKTSQSQELCYLYDDASPEHCLQLMSCSAEPLFVPERVTRSHVIPIHFGGWIDPIPVGGTASEASKIESFQITVHEVLASSVPLKVDTKIVFTQKLDNKVSTLTLNLTTDRPKLLCIVLEVKDVADNVRQARRFVLIDNTSFIETDQSKDFIVQSASSITQYTWQTHHNPICLTWKDYFLNKVYIDNYFLEHIEQDPHGLITGVYDQTSGLLPITGTENVHGIVKYEVFWVRQNGNTNSENVPDFTSQKHCLNIGVRDGETYILGVKATDIANNTLSENKTLHIDRSVPHINNIWLVKDGYKRLYVHGTKDLSELKLSFETLDPHSGIRTIEWTFGTTDARSELTTGATSVRTIEETSCPSGKDSCYCPDVGKCEMYSYVLPMRKLVAENKHQGNHNRNYFFTLKVTNHARLSNIEHLDILVDDSPPEKGVVLEGPFGGREIDFTSDDSLTVHWNGFIDHESGIKLYRVALARMCLGKNHFLNTSSLPDEIYQFKEVPSTINALNIATYFSGKMFTTVAALNNAMEMSEPVCSDGITRDITPPSLENVTLLNSQWAESLACHNGSIWLLQSRMTKVRLNNTTTCNRTCSSTSSENLIAAILPTNNGVKDDYTSNFLCETTRLITKETIIYLPHDNIYLSWSIKETGSQVDDFYVGLGVDPSESSSPSLLSYRSTNRHQYFKRHHAGIGSDQTFYIFIKAKSKAGLETFTTIGPVLIDETPPLYRNKPALNIVAEQVIIGWENDTFYDMEQTEPIHKIFFQFGHDETTITPMMEWVKNISSMCSGYTGGCIQYPVKRLQTKDTDLGLHFYASLYVYNRAGHFIKVNTDRFSVPSRYPPGHAIVSDIDPANVPTSSADTDAHTTDNTLCATWTGFKHHENILFEFAVGKSPDSADVLPYIPVAEHGYHCEKSASFLPAVKYYVSIRATCSGGKTISSSDGVQILPESFITSDLQVRVGKNCLKSNPVKTITPGKPISSLNIPMDISFKLGDRYLVKISNINAYVTIKGTEGIVESKVDTQIGNYFSVLPFVERPELLLYCNTSCTPSDVINIYECSSSTMFRPKTNITVYWGYKTLASPDIYYKMTVLEVETNKTQEIASIFTEGTRDGKSSVREELAADYFKSGKSYIANLKPCIGNKCMKSVQSGTFTIESLPPYGKIKDAEVQNDRGNCTDIYISWKRFKAESPAVVYQWAIAADIKSMQMITLWQAGRGTNDVFEVKKCIHLPVYSRRTLYACVRAFSETGARGLSCEKLDVKSLGEYNSNTVYDFDMLSPRWQDILKVLYSVAIGQTSIILHDAELDFGTSSSMVAGAIAYGNDRNISWYLMKHQKFPTVCEKDPDCAYHEENSKGFVKIPQERMEMNKIYYICALSPATKREREYFTDTLDEVRECSNGFVLDDTPPSQGNIQTTNSNGYITDLSVLVLEWDGFKDNIDATDLGYVGSIKYYSYAIGSRPGGEDIKNFTDVGIENSVRVSDIMANDGSTVFVSVKATDQAGLTTTAVSEEFLIDTTPPTSGHVLIRCRYVPKVVCNSYTIPIQISGFDDKESGIHAFELAVGSACGLSNILSEIVFSEHVNIDLQPPNMYDGHVYCITVTARNRAGVRSTSSSQQFVIDTSPPTGGHIIDGPSGSKKDIDYQTDVTHISAHWRGFEDIHSDIDYYRAGLGLSPYFDDVETMTNIGLSTEVRWNSTFSPGLGYFTTVEACNQAALCRMMVSDGVVLDNSPPIRGIVRVGSGNGHSKYISKGSSVHVRWFGFEDPQSDIDRFDVCIGSAAGNCDVLPMSPCLLQSNVIRTGLNLSDKLDYYATVKSYNKVGMSVTQSSDAFRVDSTPPEIILLPTFKTDHTSISGFTSQWDKSLLTIVWSVQDKESPITNNVVTLKTHHDGHTPVELLNVGPVSEITIELDNEEWLSDGDRYTAVVTSCNAAGHCSSAESTALLIDSTPPHLGGFKPPMTWHNFNSSSAAILSEVVLTWYGFHDEESKLDKYFITVSRSYSGKELSNGTVAVESNATSPSGLAEQSVSVILTEIISPNDLLILSIWARNEAGLNSTVARVSVNVLSTNFGKLDLSSRKGILEIEKHSCDVHFCNKDCTCAVVGQPCIEVDSNMSCIIMRSGDDDMASFPEIKVSGGIREQNKSITASATCLTAHWKLLDTVSNGTIERFEWSMGLWNQPVGEGVFDLKKRRPWNDVGNQNEVVYCLKDNIGLIHGQTYLVYVKVWYSKTTSRIYTSEAIQIDQTAPSVKRGASIKDSDSACKLDFDYIYWMGNVTACWKGVFRETQSQITHYTTALGTSQFADDIFQTTNVGLAVSKEINHLKLRHGTKYFITVTAYNSVGLHTSLSSDGFVVDMDDPVSGVVFNTRTHIDSLYQYSTTEFSVSWHGFQDHFSGIRSYSVALVDRESGMQNATTFIDVGLRADYTFTNLSLVHGKAYIGLVKATDAAGHISKVSTSRAKVIDTTSPVGAFCQRYKRVENKTFDITEIHNIVGGYNVSQGEYVLIYGTISKLENRIFLRFDRAIVDLPLVSSHDGTFTFKTGIISGKSGIRNLSLDVDHPKNESVKLQIDICESLVENSTSGVHVRQIGPSTFSAQLMILDDESSIYKVHLGVGSTPGGFQVKGMSPVHMTTSELLHIKEPHGTTLYFTAIAENHAGLRSVFSGQPVVIDKTPPIVRSRPDVQMHISNTKALRVDTTVTWSMEDSESGIKLCYCALGHRRGTTAIRKFTESDSLNTCTFGNVSVIHGDTILATVRCINHVELTKEDTSEPVVISLEKPVSDLAKVIFVSLDESSFMAPNELAVGKNDSGQSFIQSNQTCLQLQWTGFVDVSGIDHYEYRILDKDLVTKPWTGAGKDTMVLANNLLLRHGGVYTAEVRAVNWGQYVSDIASAEIIVSPKPELTGKSMEVTRVGTTLRLNWGDVFILHRELSCIYGITAGTRAGYNDVLDKAALSQTHFDAEVGSTMLSPRINEVHVSVTCSYVTGASKTYTTVYVLS